ncbi:hypothetical protein CANARDRAFT_26442 [[Candida] arabinofermentans NRRL YB-2248]|uniref:Phosphatidylserine decarboxylase proenzyme 1, mitochondrial n=1 Tax=[Candida] arabinofermentans NRRL YB-2248 TaxID=983967 RepID=A0A1E4T936_9ASCO|nr:hypothetical protein CANARDRAFT_26442 [[Candida] arabinofermentans NRRL YB-2248]
MTYRPFGLVPSSLQRSRSLAENSVKNINKPLTRATINAYNIHNQQQQAQQQQQQQQRGTRRYYSQYYYIFPKIPRPKRNVTYYKVAYVSIVTSISSKLSRGFHTSNNGKKRARFIANTKKLFGKRKYSTSSQQNQQQQQQQQQPQRKRRFLRSWFTLTSISIIFFGVVARHQIDESAVDDEEPVRPTSWPLYLYSRLPLNTVSRLWGKMNNIELPLWLREPAFKLYSKAFGVKLDEMKDPELKHYKNLGDFFYREIRPETRPLNQNALLTSPCDGKVLKFGTINDDGEIEQVKGMTYTIDSLLGTTNSKKLAAPKYYIQDDVEITKRDEEFLKLHEGITYESDGDQALTSTSSSSSTLNSTTSRILEMTHQTFPPIVPQNTRLYYAVIYLAPGDYHRFHSPTNWVATLRRHFVGELYSVAPYFQRTFNNLFVLNERVALLGYWKYGFFSMTPVGATNVGSIKVNFDQHLTTNEIYEHSIYSSSDSSICDQESTTVSENTPLLENANKKSTKKVKKNTCYEATYTNSSKLLNGQPLFKGEEMGGFRLGSTVVLVFEAPVDFEFDLKENQNVLLGQKIGDLRK